MFVGVRDVAVLGDIVNNIINICNMCMFIFVCFEMVKLLFFVNRWTIINNVDYSSVPVDDPKLILYYSK